MSRKQKGKISTEGGGGLGQNAFGDLDLNGLPEGPPAGGGKSVPKASAPRRKSRGRVELRREKAGRAGKTVTTLREFPTHVPLAELEALALKLKKTCACGGALKGRVIELQGDVVERAMEALVEAGFKPVRAGG